MHRQFVYRLHVRLLNVVIVLRMHYNNILCKTKAAETYKQNLLDKRPVVDRDRFYISLLSFERSLMKCTTNYIRYYGYLSLKKDHMYHI